MEASIVSELVQIKWIVLSIFVGMFIFLLFAIVVMTLRVRTSNTTARLYLRDNYLAELSLLESQGHYEGVVNKSGEMLSEYPNDLMANWYSAIGNRHIGQYGAALSALGRIKNISGSWSADAVDGLIEDIKAEMGGPRSVS